MKELRLHILLSFCTPKQSPAVHCRAREGGTCIRGDWLGQVRLTINN